MITIILSCFLIIKVWLEQSIRSWKDGARYWSQRPREFVFGCSPLMKWSHALRTASTYAEWAEAAKNLDIILDLDTWRETPKSNDYDYRLIEERVKLLQTMRQEGDVYGVLNTLRTGLVRNLGHITSNKLFNKSFAGTKHLIEEYVDEYVGALLDLAALPPSVKDSDMSSAEATLLQEGEDGEVGGGRGALEEDSKEASDRAAALRNRRRKGGMATATISVQHKLNFMHDSRQGYGRTALVLQGGAIFGLCHLGVVKALYKQNLLPSVIVGTATGAMMAALIGVHPEADLPRLLTGDGIDLSAFAGKGKEQVPFIEPAGLSIWGRLWYGLLHRAQQFFQPLQTRWDTLIRRVHRFQKEGYFLDVKVLEECVKANVGDLTFEEAYNRSKRVLNITVAVAENEGVPTLLNHVTAPNVIVWTAAVASNASSHTFYGSRQTKILCKDAVGEIKPWAPTDEGVDFHHWSLADYSERNAPLQRIRNMFNVNHYIVSQARPYVVPFLQSDMHGPVQGHWKWLNSATAFTTRIISCEVRHRLRQTDRIGLLPRSIRRFLVDEHLPCASLTLVPELTTKDFLRLMETPSKETLEYWIHKGERSVWPAVAALKVRCTIELEFDRAYQDVRQMKAGDLKRKSSDVAHRAQEQMKKAEREKARAEKGKGKEKEETGRRQRSQSTDVGERPPPA